jgi:hypothetical protein
MPDTNSPKVTMAHENFPEMRSEPSKNPPTRRWTCPDDQTIATYVDGALRQNRRARVELHLAKCERCRLIVADVVKLQREVELPAPPSEIARSPVRFAPPASTRSRWFWVPAAAMASIALITITISLLYQPQKLLLLSPPTPSAPVIAKAEPVAPHSTPVPEILRKPWIPEVLPVIRFPRPDSVVAGEHLEFSWKTVSHSRDYEIRVVTSDGDLAWEGQTEASVLQLPSDVVLKDGTYFVWITAYLSDGRVARSSPVRFVVKG